MFVAIEGRVLTNIVCVGLCDADNSIKYIEHDSLHPSGRVTLLGCHRELFSEEIHLRLDVNLCLIESFIVSSMKLVLLVSTNSFDFPQLRKC